MTAAIFTRAEYMRTCGEAQSAAAHRRYYAQGVTPWLRDSVVSWIGAEALRNSRDPHLNDIPLQKWDNLAGWMTGPVVAFNKKVGNGACYSLCDVVCIAKEAARQWIEQDAKENAA